MESTIQLTIELSILALAGIAIHYLKHWAKASQKGQEYNIKKMVPTIVLSVITSLLLVYLRDDVKDIYVITRFGAVVLGYVGNSAFFSFVEVRKPKIGKES